MFHDCFRYVIDRIESIVIAQVKLNHFKYKNESMTLLITKLLILEIVYKATITVFSFHAKPHLLHLQKPPGYEFKILCMAQTFSQARAPPGYDAFLITRAGFLSLSCHPLIFCRMITLLHDHREWAHQPAQTLPQSVTLPISLRKMVVCQIVPNK